MCVCWYLFYRSCQLSVEMGEFLNGRVWCVVWLIKCERAFEPCSITLCYFPLCSHKAHYKAKGHYGKALNDATGLVKLDLVTIDDLINHAVMPVLIAGLTHHLFLSWRLISAPTDTQEGCGEPHSRCLHVEIADWIWTLKDIVMKNCFICSQRGTHVYVVPLSMGLRT